MEIRTVSKKKAKIRLGLSAVSGGGKTMGALLIAYGITGDWTRVGLIDTENGSGDLYEHLGPYRVLTLEPPFSPQRYIQAIGAMEAAGLEVIIIDSISYEWEGEGGMLEMVDKLGGEFQSAWKKATPLHNLFKRAILFSSCHVICTVRRKQDYVLQERTNRSGHKVNVPVKNGFKEITREGWEYELTVNLEVDVDHLATASKDRTGLFMGRDPFVISAQTGEQIRDWCERGVDPQVELDRAVQQLAACVSVADLTALKNSLPEYIAAHPKFKEAGLAQFNLLSAPAQPVGSDKAPAEPAPADALLDRDGQPLNFDKYLLDANDVDKVNATLRWLRGKQKDNPAHERTLQGWIDALHDKAVRTLKLTYNSAKQVYFEYTPADALPA